MQFPTWSIGSKGLLVHIRTNKTRKHEAAPLNRALLSGGGTFRSYMPSRASLPGGVYLSDFWAWWTTLGQKPGRYVNFSISSDGVTHTNLSRAVPHELSEVSFQSSFFKILIPIKICRQVISMTENYPVPLSKPGLLKSYPGSYSSLYHA